MSDSDRHEPPTPNRAEVRPPLTAPTKAKVPTLIARYQCGCLSQMIRIDLSSGEEIVKFCISARRRRCWVENIQLGMLREVQIECGKTYCDRPKVKS